MCFFAIRGWFRRVKRHWTTDQPNPKERLNEAPIEATETLPCQPPSHDILSDKRLLLATPKGNNESDSTARLEELPLHVIVLISNHLPDTCRMSLALTCHSLSRALFNHDEQPQITVLKSSEESGPSLKLENMPLDLIFLVANYLTEVSQLTLALTCRSLYSVYCNYKQPRLATRGDREEFLQLLEKDVANLYFCYDCVQLHPWSHTWDPWGEKEFELETCANSARHTVSFGDSGTLMYHHARLFVSRHLYGTEHGLPLSKLEDQQTKISQNGVRVHKTRSARIIDNELFVLATYRIDHPQGKQQKLRRFMDKSGHSICHHVKTTPRLLGQWTVKELKRHTFDVPFTACEDTTSSCPMCLTDYTISITWRGKTQGWIIDTRVYKLLGSCRSPYQWEWRSASEVCRFNEPRSLHYRAGIVRRRWIEVDGVETNVLEGEFVGSPKNLDRCIPGIRRCPWNTYDHSNHDCATYGLRD